MSTEDRTLAETLRAKTDLAQYAATERGRAHLGRLLDEQRDIRSGHAETARRSNEGIARCDEAIEIIEQALNGSLPA